jgi:predicted secreted protein
MANPNIVNVTSIYGDTLTHYASTTEGVFISNSAQSGSIIKVNTIFAANINGSSAADVTVKIGTASGAYVPIMSTISVPADSTLVVVDKNTSLYLPEGWDMTVQASASDAIRLVVSYEEIS